METRTAAQRSQVAKAAQIAGHLDLALFLGDDGYSDATPMPSPSLVGSEHGADTVSKGWALFSPSQALPARSVVPPLRGDATFFLFHIRPWAVAHGGVLASADRSPLRNPFISQVAASRRATIRACRRIGTRKSARFSACSKDWYNACASERHPALGSALDQAGF